MSVTHLDKYRPTTLLHLLDGNAAIFPTSMLKDVVEGKLSLQEIDNWEMIVKSIVKDWLDNAYHWRK